MPGLRLPSPVPPPEHASGLVRYSGDGLAPVGGRALPICITAIDFLLRRWYRIVGLGEAPDCVLRISPAAADRALRLPDGTELRPGDPIIDLHLWNDRLPRIGPRGPDLAWAARFRRHLEASFRLLAARAATDPALGAARALRAHTLFSEAGRVDKLARICAGYGLVWPETERLVAPDPMRSLLVWALTRAFNPGGMRPRICRLSATFWMSRHALERRFRQPPPLGASGLQLPGPTAI